MGADAEFPHQYRPQRHHDHEVEDVRELDAGQRDQQGALARRIEGFRGRRMVHGGAGVDVSRQERHGDSLPYTRGKANPALSANGRADKPVWRSGK